MVGGTRAVLADGQLYSGGEHVYVALDENTGKSGFGWIDAHQIAIAGNDCYIATGTQVMKLDRKTYLATSRERMKLDDQIQNLARKIRTPSKELEQLRTQYAEMLKSLAALAANGVVWKSPSACDSELILTGNLMFAGGPDRVDAFDVATGNRVWTTKVDGTASGLAVANGYLIVSTTKGEIQVFADATKTVAEQARSQSPRKPKPTPRNRLTMRPPKKCWRPRKLGRGSVSSSGRKPANWQKPWPKTVTSPSTASNRTPRKSKPPASSFWRPVCMVRGSRFIRRITRRSPIPISSPI